MNTFNTLKFSFGTMVTRKVEAAKAFVGLEANHFQNWLGEIADTDRNDLSANNRKHYDAMTHRFCVTSGGDPIMSQHKVSLEKVTAANLVMEQISSILELFAAKIDAACDVPVKEAVLMNDIMDNMVEIQIVRADNSVELYRMRTVAKHMAKTGTNYTQTTVRKIKR